MARLLIAVIFGTTILIIACNYLVLNSTKNALYNSADDIPYNKVGVLLGTSKYSRQGGYNDHYRLRIEAAVTLFLAEKIDYILISGDNSSRYYDEPSTIRRDLLNSGIPSEKIYRDYAGFRTLDSIIRAHKVFNLPGFTVISQATHNMRAIYIAHSQDIDAIAFNAGQGRNTDWKNRVREWLARVLAVLEVNMLNTKPKYLGPIIGIGVTPPT
ncbi:hypothetical protein ACH42_12655 [Endozoicomonas sp. (ex Bugula neritina AB1)]|nr:hypothetical protein ACH42_12655 [Endozoicomonas sp. (ex Bugula neritina AB1)]